MRLTFRVLALVVLGVVAVACSEERTAPTSPGLDITRGQGGIIPRNLYFLGHTIDNPTFLGTFDSTLAPVVVVTGPSGAVVAQFTTTTGHGPTRVRVFPNQQEYRASWTTRSLDAGTYVVTVWVDGFILGHFDAILASKKRDLRGVDTWNYVPVRIGQPLAIRFRIETGAPIPVGLAGHYSGPCWGSPCAVHSTPDWTFWIEDFEADIGGVGGDSWGWLNLSGYCYLEYYPQGYTEPPAPCGAGGALGLTPHLYDSTSNAYDWIVWIDGEEAGYWNGNQSGATMEIYYPYGYALLFTRSD